MDTEAGGPSPEELGLQPEEFVTPQATPEVAQPSSVSVPEGPDIQQAISSEAFVVDEEDGSRLSQEESEEVLQALPSRARLARSLRAARKNIQKHIDNGEFPDEAQREQALRAVSYQGERETEDSEALKSINAVLRSLPGEAEQKILAEVQRYQQVHVMENGVEQSYTVAQWQERLGSVTDEERTTLEEQVKYGYEFPQDNATVQEGQEVNASPEDQLIAIQATQLEQRIREAKVQGQDTALQEQFLVTLQLAQNARGELGAPFRLQALQKLQEAGVDVDESILGQTQAKATEAQKVLGEELKKIGITDEQIRQIQSEDLAGLGEMVKIWDQIAAEGLDAKIFGRAMPQEEVEKLIAHLPISEEVRRKLALGEYGKTTGVLLLIILLALPALAASSLKEASKQLT